MTKVKVGQLQEYKTICNAHNHIIKIDPPKAFTA